MRTLRIIGVRIASALVTLVGVSVLVFAAMHAAPGSYAQIVLGPTSTAAGRAHLEQQFGLDESLPTQFVRWLDQAAHGNLGVSMSTSEPVARELLRRAPVTLELTLLATILSVVIGIPLGFAAALGGRRRRLAALSRAAGALALSTPDFVVGTILLYVFSRYSLGLTVGGYVPFTSDPIGNLKSMLLPAITLGVFTSALVMRTTRTAVLSVLSDAHITASVARGEAPSRILRRHVLRNTAIPIVTVVGTNVGYLLGGAVIVETLFSLPGFGSFLVSAVQTRDYAVVQAGALIAAMAFIVVNLVVDLSYGLFDPRVTRWQR